MPYDPKTPTDKTPAAEPQATGWVTPRASTATPVQGSGWTVKAAEAGPAWAVAPAQPEGSITRVYPGKLSVATLAFQNDAASMAKSGWFPTSQAYQAGNWSAGAFLLALVLCLVAIGILIFIYMLIVRPDGALVVTYQVTEESQRMARQGGSPTQPRPPQSPAPGPANDHVATLRALADMKDQGLISQAEFDAKKADLLGRM